GQRVSALGRGSGGAVQRRRLRRRGDRKGARVSDAVPAAHACDQPRPALFLWSVLRRAGDVARRRRLLASLVSGDSRRATHPPERRRRFVGRLDLLRVWNRDGVSRAANAERSAADFPTLVWAMSKRVLISAVIAVAVW